MFVRNKIGPIRICKVWDRLTMGAPQMPSRSDFIFWLSVGLNEIRKDWFTHTFVPEISNFHDIVWEKETRVNRSMTFLKTMKNQKLKFFSCLSLLDYSFQRRRKRGDGGYLPLLFENNFLRFQEKVKFSPNLRENPSKILWIWEKIRLKSSEFRKKSSELGENPSEILQVWEKIH